MKFCEKISQEQVLKKAMALIRSAEKQIFVTMNLKEEILQPLPDYYHEKLIEKSKQGVEVTRIGYGTKKDYKKLAPQYTDINFIYGGSLEKYQRMLLVDNMHGLFRIADVTYFTQYIPLFRILKQYAKDRTL